MEIIKPKDVRNNRYYFLGGVYTVLNYMRRNLIGYNKPRPFSINQIERAIDYDFRLVEQWIEYLRNYSKESDPLKGKVILELGPGPDLGVGLILLALGANKYITLDVNNLIKSTPLEFYKQLFDEVKRRYSNCNVDYLREQLDECLKGGDGRITYVVDKNFEIAKIKDEVDIVLSHAAFEHFDDVENTIKEISYKIKEDGILCLRIDLQTHGRWIRDRDPLNIYRYSDLFWKAFKYKGSLNRVRTPQYKQLLEKNNWFDIKIKPVRILEKEYVKRVMISLNRKFKDYNISEMQILGVVLMASRKKSRSFLI
jgi:SAM-dependent methyltransferase